MELKKIQLQDVGGNWVDSNLNDWKKENDSKDGQPYYNYTDKRGLASQGPRKVKIIWSYK